MARKRTGVRALMETKGDVLAKGVSLKQRDSFKKDFRQELKARGLDMNDYYVKAINFSFKHPEIILGA